MYGCDLVIEGTREHGYIQFWVLEKPGARSLTVLRIGPQTKRSLRGFTMR